MNQVGNSPIWKRELIGTLVYVYNLINKIIYTFMEFLYLTDFYKRKY